MTTTGSRCFCGAIGMSRNRPLCSDHRHLTRHLRDGAQLDPRLTVLVGSTLTGNDCVPHNHTRSHRDQYLLVSWPDGRRTTASRIICELVNGPAPSPRHQAAHSCGHAWCIVGGHLSWRLPAENLADRQRHGTVRYSPPVRARIRRVVGSVATMRVIPASDLARQCHVSERTITKWARAVREAA